MIQPNEIEKINIEDLLNDYGLEPRVSVTQNANFCCPFHKEKNPSCGMKISTGLWKCFGCGLSGNIVSFVAEMEEISLKEAEQKIRSKWIEKRPDIPTIVDTVQKILSQKEDKYEQEVIYPKWILSKYSKDWSYMSTRGFEHYTCEHFNVVYDSNIGYQGFPCFNLNGDLVGVTGRNTKGGEPRYFPLIRFKKSQYIFNFQAIDKEKPVIAVEGEINVMAMWQKGYPNTIAFLGAGVSEHQIELLKNSGIKELIIFFDSDTAGKHGTNILFKNLWLYMKITCVKDHKGDAADLDESTIKSLIENREEFTIVL